MGVDANRSPLSLSLLSDSPLDNRESDYFGFSAYADSLATLIVDPSTETPVTLAISAPWGGGKTSVARLVERRIVEWTDESLGQRPDVICWFNAWSHDDAPHLGASLAASVARAANRRRPLWRRLVEPLPSTMLSPRERWRRRAAIGVATLVVVGFCLMISPIRDAFSSLELVEENPLAGLGTIGGVVALGFVLWPKIFSAAEHAARFVENPGAEAAAGAMSEVREQLGRLVHQGTRGARLVLFVDDLERCRPARAVEVCETASQLLSQHDFVTVLVADMSAISVAAQELYGNLEATDQASASGIATVGQRYLEKIVQIQVTLPPPRTEDMRRLLRGDAPPAR